MAGENRNVRTEQGSEQSQKFWLPRANSAGIIVPGQIQMITTNASEISSGARFEFGENWSRFLKKLNQERINDAKQSLCEMLDVKSLNGKRFLDIGSGSGLFSLAAALLGAHVHSFDYDPKSVACTKQLKSRFLPENPNWVIEEGSVLDPRYIQALGKFDIVYSWGVLHHTGDMWNAIDNAAACVAPEGICFITIYNDQGIRSKYWWMVKKIYNANFLGKYAMIAAHLVYPLGISVVVRTLTGRLRDQGRRGMSYWYDYIDWLGGLPFEVASPTQMVSHFEKLGFRLVTQKLTSRKGCNEFVFRRLN